MISIEYFCADDAWRDGRCQDFFGYGLGRRIALFGDAGARQYSRLPLHDACKMLSAPGRRMPSRRRMTCVGSESAGRSPSSPTAAVAREMTITLVARCKYRHTVILLAGMTPRYRANEMPKEAFDVRRELLRHFVE